MIRCTMYFLYLLRGKYISYTSNQNKKIFGDCIYKQIISKKLYNMECTQTKNIILTLLDYMHKISSRKKISKYNQQNISLNLTNHLNK